MANEVEQALLANGQTTKTVITNTAEVRGGWRLIHVIEAATFTVLVDSLLDTGRGAGSLLAIAFPVGAVIGGNFTNIKLASGKIIAYS